MGEVVNLRRARKERVRREKDEKAQENRVAFGRTKSERDTTAALNRLDAARLDAHKREGEEGDTP
jgi:Domain of unknown function (DUF4169)